MVDSAADVDDRRMTGLSVAIGGLGAIGVEVARRLRGIPELRLGAVAARDRKRALNTLRQLGYDEPPPVVALEELAGRADVVVECAPAAVFEQVAVAALEAGRVLLPLSVGALLPRWHLVELAARTGARIMVPSGALLGLDAVRAASEGEIRSVRMVTRKPPAGLAGAPLLRERGVSLEGLREPLQVFRGNAREGAAGFPANVNVAAALALAGIGPDRTELEIWADPGIERNTHHVTVDADSARFEFTMYSIPSDQNPRTGRIVALSVVSALRSLVSPLTVGV